MDSCHRRINAETWISSVGMFILTSTLVWAGSPGDLKPRVPPEQLEEAQSFQNPFTPSPDILVEGKKLYEGKAFCSACHGLEGASGPSGGLTTPSGAQPPTKIADAAWQAARTDGEIFWILKHGSHGTDMAPYMPLYLSEEEVWQIVSYIRTFGDI
jgi:mono/diheme cytochrome c family protein